MRIKYFLYILFFALTIFSKQVIAQEVSMSDIQNIKVYMLNQCAALDPQSNSSDEGF